MLAVVLLLPLTFASASAQSPSAVDVIVVLEDVANPSDVARDHRVNPTYVYEHALTGFAASIPEARLRGLENDPRVRYLELDQVVTVASDQAVTAPTGIRRIGADANTEIGIDGHDDERVDVDVAVLDTGIDLDHPDLNVVGGVNCLEHSGGPPWSRTYECVNGGDDGHGHGTHVAGTIAALDDGPNFDGVDVVGVAPGARLWAVKVLDDNGSGSTGSVMAGIDWVAAQVDPDVGGPLIEVANMSLGGSGESTAVDDMLEKAYKAGVAFAVAAGNSSTDVDGYWPAGSPWVLTVSALADFDGQAGGGAASTCGIDEEDDTFAYFSNYGAKSGQDVDVIAPGVCILSTYPGGGYADGFSGTSMASPHVAGAAALLASAGKTAVQIVGDVSSNSIDGDGLIEAYGDLDWSAVNESEDPDGVTDPLVDITATDTEKNFVYSPSLIATGGTGGGDTNAAPTASFTYNCTDLACNFDGSGSGDSDGTIQSYDWNFGDETTATGETVSHTYGTGGKYTVTLTVTDDDGVTDSTSQEVAVSEPSTDGIVLDATGNKIKGEHYVNLTWNGASGELVDVYRDGLKVTTTANDGEHTDVTGGRGGGSYDYHVCEASSMTVCSRTVTVEF